MKDGYEPIHKLAMIQLHPQRNPRKRFSSFKIDDILKPGDSDTVSELLKVGRDDVYEGGHGLSVFPRPGLFCTNNHSGLYQLNSSAIELCGSIRNRHRLDAVTRTALSLRGNTLRDNHFGNVPSETLHKIVRPWDVGTLRSRTEELARLQKEEREHLNVESSSDSEEEITVDDDPPPKLKKASPLDALVQMTSKTFEGINGDGSADGARRDGSSGFGKSQPPRKKRKSRTAFTNQQIYELEKRFLYQKYLTPADRDEIAHSLGLTNAQVITWFQNRRAKLKRDLEELKNDVMAGDPTVDDLPVGHEDRHYAVRLHQHQSVVNIHEQDDDMGISGLNTSCSLSPGSVINRKCNNNNKNNINNNNNNNNINNNEQQLHKICSTGLSRSNSCSSVASNSSLTHVTTNSSPDTSAVTSTNTSDSQCNVPPKIAYVDNHVPENRRL